MRIPLLLLRRARQRRVHLGDASVVRPEADAAAPLDAAPRRRWADYVSLRDNPAGVHRELCQHVAGCRAWLVVTRHLRRHEIISVEPARDVALARDRAEQP